MIKHEIYVSREKSGMGHNNAASLIKKAASMALDAEGVDRPCLISVMLTDNKGIRETNRDFRGIDAATDVLSFPLNELTPGKFNASLCDTHPYTGAVMLRDMMISLERRAEQREEPAHGFDREVSYLTVHSVLHLLGYDHIDEGEMKKQMRTREKEIMGDK